MSPLVLSTIPLVWDYILKKILYLLFLLLPGYTIITLSLYAYFLVPVVIRCAHAGARNGLGQGRPSGQGGCPESAATDAAVGYAVPDAKTPEECRRLMPAVSAPSLDADVCLCRPTTP